MKTIELGLSKEVSKAYQEGIYTDTPSNRKLGRVGMTYTAYAEKIKKGDYNKDEGVRLSDFSNGELRVTIKQALKKAKDENKVFLVGHDSDNNLWIDDAINYYGGLDKKKVDATCFPDGKIKKGFVEVTKSWDKQEDFYKEGSDEKKLWDFWYKFQKSGDPSNISSMRMILEKKFPNVEKWKQTTPNTGKAQLSAIVKDKEIAKIDLSGDKIDLTKLQTFMDKCYDVKPKLETKIDFKKQRTLLNKAEKLLKEGKEEEVKKIFKQAFKDDTNHINAHLLTESNKEYSLYSKELNDFLRKYYIDLLMKPLKRI